MRLPSFAVTTAAAVLSLLTALPSRAAISLSTTTPTVERFDGMGTAAAATVPTDFKVDKPTTVRTVGTYAAAATATTLAGGANLSTTASNGVYNFGSGTTTTGPDRAVGFLSSGSATSSGNLYAAFVNSTSGNVSGLTISYDVEKYRNGINPNGFRIQLFYSMDGNSWTSAGSDFLTSFGPDSGTNVGFATAPGVTSSIADKTLNVSIPSGGQVYLAWNYSVSATSTTTNAQALAIDNVSVLAIGGGTPGTTSPSGTGAANPASVQTGGSSQLSVTVTPGANPASTALAVSADLSSIGGAVSQAFADAGGNNFTFIATVAPGTSPGPKSLPATIVDGEGRSGSAVITLTVVQPPPPIDHIVISQVYGGGGNAGAIFNRDFVELFNPGTTTIDVTGWSVQYASSAGNVSGVQPLAGALEPGQYYLVGLATGAEGGALPEPNVSGDLNLSGTTGKIALVNNSTALAGGCPVSDVSVVDYVGYGTATCREGATASNNAPSPSNTTAILRKSLGALDTNDNFNDFATGTPTPRRTATIVEVGPRVVNADPQTGPQGAPRDTTITISFSEPVTVDASWFTILCVTTGAHNDATMAGSGKVWAATPNVTFTPGEQCTATILKDAVHDADIDDATPGTDTLPADYSWTFTIATGTAPPFPPEVHLTMGNPTNAITSLAVPNNYLMMKPEFALSYNRDKGSPNWVSWHLSDEWTGGLTRIDTFRPDPEVPSNWYRVQAFDFQNTGFDRGHMTPNADRNKVTSSPINQATFLMSNMLAQAPGNNQGPWGNFENFLRTLLPVNELYIVSGPAGVGGTGDSGFASTLANGHVTVPSSTWKVALVLPKLDGNDISRVTAATRTIAVIMPNVSSIRNDNYESYYTTVDAVESLTGYNLFSNLPVAVQNSIEAGLNGNNPPGVADQAIGVTEDTAKDFTLDVASVGSVTTTVLSGPAHGTLNASGANVTFTPAPDYFGNDSFTYRVSDGTRSSNTGTVTFTVLEVNDPATATNDVKTATEDTTLSFAAADLTANDSAGPANESSQTLTVTSVSATADTHGTVSLSGGQVSYNSELNYNGPASFTYQVCDNGFTGGMSSPQCASATVSITVAEANDPVTATDDSKSTTEDTTLTFAASDLAANDSAGPANESSQTLTVTSVSTTANTHGTVSLNAGQVSYTPQSNYNGAASFTYQVCDNGFTAGVSSPQCATGTVHLAIAEANDAPSATITVTPSAPEGSAVTATVNVTDPDAGETFTYSWTVTRNGSPFANGSNSAITFTPADNGAYAVSVIVTDHAGATATDTKSVTVTNVAPVITSATLSATTIDENGTVTLSGTFSDSGDDTHTLTINWGDGSAIVPVVLTHGARAFSLSHQYRDDAPTATPADTYTLAVTVSDNDGGSATGATSLSVRNVAPVITSVTGPVAALKLGTAASIVVKYSDVGSLDTHSATLTWDDGTTSAATCAAGTCTATHTFAATGVYGVVVTLSDDDTGTATGRFSYVVVFDPKGSVSGDGWINSPAGAFVGYPTLTGRLSFDLEVKFKKGVPSGKLELELKDADVKFDSTSIDSVVIAGSKAQIRGTGRIGDHGRYVSYGYLVTVVDGDLITKKGQDKFRIRVWDKTTGATVYDNVAGASDDIDNANPQQIGSGKITIKGNDD